MKLSLIKLVIGSNGPALLKMAPFMMKILLINARRLN